MATDQGTCRVHRFVEGRDRQALGLIDEASAKRRMRTALGGGYSPVLRWYRGMRPPWLWQRINRNGKVTRAYISEYGLEVRHGPFAGMRFPRRAVGRANFLPTKLLGCYERELEPALEQAIADEYSLFVEVGSGDGYYCVGFKTRSPRTCVMGFETDATHRRLSQRVAELNQVSIELAGAASPETLNRLPPGRLFLMTDVEGYEVELLDIARVPRLQETTMLVEIHEAEREITNAFQERFGETHDLTLIEGSPRSQDDYAELRAWPVESAHWALSEGRSELPRWMLMKPRTR